MKKQMTRLLSLMLALVLCLGLLPAAAAAEEKPAISDVAEAAIACGTYDVPVETGKVLLPRYDDKYQLNLKVNGAELPKDQYYYRIEASADGNMVYSSVRAGKEDDNCYFTLPAALKGWKTVSLTLKNSDGEVFGSGELELYFGTHGEYPLTHADLVEKNKTIVVPAGKTSLDVRLYFPWTVEEGVNSYVRVELLDSEGNCRGITERSAMIYEGSVEDIRYEPIFGKNSLPSAPCGYIGTNVCCGSPLQPGSYSVRIIPEDGSETMLFRDAVSVTGSLMAELLKNGTIMTQDGKQLYAASVQIRNGAPTDFEVQIVQGDTVIARSEGCRPNKDREAKFLYVMELPEDGLGTAPSVSKEQLLELFYAYGVEDWETAPEELKEYIMEETGLSAAEIKAILSGESAGELEIVLVSKSGKEIVGQSRMAYSGRELDKDGTYLDETAAFDNHFYGSVFAPGPYEEDDYRLELEYNNNVLSTAFAVPDKNGALRAMFTDEEGNLLPIENNKGYSVEIYAKRGGGWPYVDSLWIRNENLHQEYLAVLMEQEQTLPLDIPYASLGKEDDNLLRCYIEAEESVLAELTDCEVHLLPMGSEEPLILSEVPMEEQNPYSRYFELDTPLTDGYYTAKLYCGGKLVVDLEGNNPLGEYPLNINSSVVGRVLQQSFRNNPLYLFTGCRVQNADENAEIRLDLYALGNTSVVPDHSFTLDTEMYCYLTPEQVAELGSGMYSGVLWADDTLLEVTEYNFWSSDRWAWDLEYFSVSVDPAIAELATVELIPSCPVDENGDYQAYSEIFVKITPNRGRTLEEILINGQPLSGSAFILNKDETVISATFGELPVNAIGSAQILVQNENYDYVDFPDGAVVTYRTATEENVTSAIVGETVTVTVEPAEGYLAQYVLLGTSYLDRNEDGTWSFVMPEDDVTIQVRMREKFDVYVNPFVVGEEGGSLTVENGTADGAYYVLEKGEDGPVTVVATPDEGYCLAELYYEIYDFNAYDYVRYDQIEEPMTGVVRRTFTAPDTQFVIKAVFGKMEAKAVGSYTDSKNNQVMPNVTEQMPGGEVILTVQPIENFALKAGSLKVKSAEGAVELTKINDNTYSFVMPWFDVTVTADFLCVAPGGVVTDAQTLLTALGGAGTLEDGTVTLQEDVVLLAPVDVQDGTMTLNVNGHTITGPDASTVMTVSGNADVTMFNGYVKPGENSGTDCYGILLKNGKLTLSGELTIYSGTTTEEDSSAAVKVEGGELLLTARKVSHSMRAPRLEGIGCGDGLRITGGTVTMEDGTALGGTYWGDMPEVASEPGLQGGGFEGNTSTPGGNGIWITGTGNLTFLEEAGCSGGANHAGLMIGTATEAAEGTIRITGGDLDGGSGGVGLWVRKKAADLQISGGIYWPGYNYDWMYSIILEGSVMADYLQDGCLIQTPADKWQETPAIPLSDNRQTYEDKVEVVPCGLPIFADTELTEETVTLTETEGIVTVELAQLGQTVHVMAAFYDADGKLVGFDMVPVRRGAQSVTLAAELSAAAQTVRVFLTDATTDIPVSQCLNWSK